MCGESGSIRVLVADDDDVFAALIGRLLAGYGCVIVSVVADASAAVEAAQRVRVDVVLTDVDMPQGGGLRVAETFAASSIAVVAITADVMVDKRVEAAFGGFNAVGPLSKSQTPDVIASALRFARCQKTASAPFPSHGPPLPLRRRFEMDQTSSATQSVTAVDSGAQITVFLVDDHPVTLDGIRAAISSHDGMTVVGEAGTAREAVARIAATRPQVALIDWRLPDAIGSELCAAVRQDHPAVKCVMFSAFADREALHAAITAGAVGFLEKSVTMRALLSAIEDVAGGLAGVDSTVTGHLLSILRQPEPVGDSKLAALSRLERDILKHVAQGLTNRDIAVLVHVSETTVKNYVSSILRKLNLSRRTEAAIYALKSGEF